MWWIAAPVRRQEFAKIALGCPTTTYRLLQQAPTNAPEPAPPAGAVHTQVPVLIHRWKVASLPAGQAPLQGMLPSLTGSKISAAWVRTSS